MTQRTSNLLVWAGTIVFVVAVSVLGWAGHPVEVKARLVAILYGFMDPRVSVA